MEYQFKKFKNVKGRFENRITITKSYSFGFPTKFYDDNNINKFKYVVLFYDEKKKAIAFFFTNDETERNKFSLNHHEKYGGSVSARSFFKTYGLNPKKYKGKYQWEKKKLEGVGKVFIINLRDK